MTDYNTWFKAPIRKGVLNPDDTITPEFDNWTKSCTGKVRVTKVFIEGIVYPVLLPVFELEEDKVSYLLTWTESILRSSTAFDAAAFYAPYIPLQSISVSATGPIQLATFNTRYFTTPHNPSKSNP